MSKYKVCVYAIAKNEEQFVSRWYQSMKEADEIYVLDTGSTDHTVQKLEELGVYVKQEIFHPWRFDVARNHSLDMVPEDVDICVCTDLDEVFEPGWREALESSWNDHLTRIRYRYNWSLDENHQPIVSFYLDNIHTRNDYDWTHPVHEVLTYKGESNENYGICEQICLNHYPDRSKSRSSYLPLLELSVREDPDNDRNMHYLGREYMYYGRWNDCIDTLIRHLHLKSATWKDERCASMRFIARSYIALNRYDEASMWYDKAILEAPYLRDAYVEKAMLDYQLKNWKEIEKNCLRALEIKTHVMSYINEVFSWDYTIYDLLSISCFYQGKFSEALEWSNQALEMAPDQERLLSNHHIFEKHVQNASTEC